MDSNKPQVYWLNGTAGTGKSTITATFVERVPLVGASFFCSRDPMHLDLSNPKLIFPTLAVTLAKNYPKFGSNLFQSIKSAPDLVSMSLDEQIRRLIVDPLEKSGVSTVIAIDALDECGDEGTGAKILSALGDFMPRIPNVKFFITSRPEPHIENQLLPLEEVGYITKFALHEVEQDQTNRDIRKYLKEKLKVLALAWELDECDFPTNQDLDLLCGHAARVFAHAAAMVKFLNSGWDFRDRLHLLLQQVTEGGPGSCRVCRAAWGDKRSVSR